MQAEVRASTSALKAAEAKAANYAKQVAAMDPPTALQRGLSPLARGGEPTASRVVVVNPPVSSHAHRCS